MKIGWATTGSARTCSSFKSSGTLRHFRASAGDLGGTAGLGAGFLSSRALARARAKLIPRTATGMTTLVRMLLPYNRCQRDDVSLRLVDAMEPVNDAKPPATKRHLQSGERALQSPGHPNLDLF